MKSSAFCLIVCKVSFQTQEDLIFASPSNYGSYLIPSKTTRNRHRILENKLGLVWDSNPCWKDSKKSVWDSLGIPIYWDSKKKARDSKKKARDSNWVSTEKKKQKRRIPNGIPSAKWAYIRPCSPPKYFQSCQLTRFLGGRTHKF